MEIEWPSNWILILALLVLGLYLLGTWPYDYFRIRNLPFVKPIPFIGNIGASFFRKKSFPDVVIELYTKFKGYSVAGYFEFLNPVILIMDPEIIRSIAVKDFDYFTDHRSPIREEEDPLFGGGMFTLQGERWRGMRHTLSPAFTSSKMKAMFLLVRDIGIQLGDHLAKRCSVEKGNLLTIEMKELFTRYANDVIASAAFGLRCDSLEDPDNEFHRVGREVSNLGGIRGFLLLGFFFSPKLMKMLKLRIVSKKNADYFRELVHGTMETRERQNIFRPDMIHLLMQARKGTLKDDVIDDVPEGTAGDKERKKVELTDEEITANALLFFLAGFDTSSTMLSFLSYVLAVHPDVQRRVQQEMDYALEKNHGELTYETIQNMKYLDMVISETLRLYPPAMTIDRMCCKPYTIPATSSSPAVYLNTGDSVNFPVIALHRDPEYFPDPMRFDPERFSEENKHKIKPFTYLPFGVGPRACIGMRFALMSAKISMTSLLTKFDLEVVAKTPIRILIGKASFINLEVEGGIWLGIKPRVKTGL